MNAEDIRKIITAKNTVIIDALDLTQEDMEKDIVDSGVKIALIDSIEVMPFNIDLESLIKRISNSSCKCIMITSHHHK